MGRVIRASVAGLGVVAAVLMGALGVTLQAESALLAFTLWVPETRAGR